MAITTTKWRRRAGCALFLFGWLVALSTVSHARAEHSAFRVYDTDSGLLSLDGACMAQDPGGYLLACTEHGLFAYDGRIFTNLGPAQGLLSGGEVFGLALTADGRIAVAYAGEVFVSDRPAQSAAPPDTRHFQLVQHPGISFYAERYHRVASWHGDFVFLTGDVTDRIVTAGDARPHLEAMGYSREEELLLKAPAALFSAGGHLWETFDDNRICVADPGTVKCYDVPEGLANGPWRDVVETPDHHIMARSASSVATFDAASGRWSVAALPDQGGRYINYERNLRLFAAPDGRMMTQTNHGLAVLSAGRWEALTVEDGAPAGTIMGAITDTTGQMWFQVFGEGLVRWIGYGRWESLQKQDGLSDGLPWMTARAIGGPLWISTDSGVDKVVRDGKSLRVTTVLPGASFVVAIDQAGELWRSTRDGLKVTNPSGNEEAKIVLPLVDAICAGPGDTMWVGTEGGLFKVDRSGPSRFHSTLVGPSRSPVVDVAPDREGGIYYLSAGHLRHRTSDGRDTAMVISWPNLGFEPDVITTGRNGDVWVGGLGGLFRLAIEGDQVAATETIPTEVTRTNSVNAVMFDHRGWLWVGTAMGVSVFDGRQWASIDTDDGLISDDIEQRGLREDEDGSVWIVTTQGVSHLLDASSIFRGRPLSVVISSARLGDSPVGEKAFPFSEQPLALQFGTSNYGAEKSIRFRYMLSGVDSDWAETSSGSVRYAFVPPGRHVLTVIGYDALSHRSSAATSLAVEIGYPWWRQWWAELAGAVVAVGVVCGTVQLRTRQVRARQAELQRHVAEATEKLRLQTEELRHQAAHDRLTGLLTRSEVEQRLATKLARGFSNSHLIVAMLDIDFFKRVNDEHGHLAGDDVLRAVGRMIRATIRSGEYAGRYGGEEILLVLDDSDGCGVNRVLDLHHAMRGSPFGANGRAIRVTCSVGVAYASSGDDWESLIGRADEALYEAKASGRDQVKESARSAPAARNG